MGHCPCLNRSVGFSPCLETYRPSSLRHIHMQKLTWNPENPRRFGRGKPSTSGCTSRQCTDAPMCAPVFQAAFGPRVRLAPAFKPPSRRGLQEPVSFWWSRGVPNAKLSGVVGTPALRPLFFTPRRRRARPTEGRARPVGTGRRSPKFTARGAREESTAAGARRCG